MGLTKNKALFLAVLFILMFLCYGCQDSPKEEEEGREDEVKIPIILTIDPSTGNKQEEDIVEAFNRQYEGKYEIEAEWILETENEYWQNLKRLNAADKLPAIITDLKRLPSFYGKMIADGRIENLYSYIMEDEEWKSMVDGEVLESCMEGEEKMYLAPLGNTAFSCSGIFYNEKLFEIAGIEKFPETWDEFWECCEMLDKCGVAPLALHTEETAWAPMLFATAELADTKEGMEFMDEAYPESYSNESGRHLAETLIKLFSYSEAEALYSNYDVAYENFFSSRAAMIPGGYRMACQIPEDWQDKVRFAPFPGNKLVASPETSACSIVSGYSREVKDGAAQFLKFRTRMNREKWEKLSNMEVKELSAAQQDYIKAFKNQPLFVPNYQIKWNSVLQEQVLEECLPELANGSISTEEFTKRADESIRKFQAER